MKYLLIFILGMITFSCQDSKRENVMSLLKKWDGREIVFPDNLVFTIRGKDTVNFSSLGKYKILSYVDSTGCTSCKLKLEEWSKFIHQMDSLTCDTTKFLFVFFPKDGTEIYQSLRIAKFNYPICIDEEDVLNRVNHFSSDMAFQTFLLDENNKVLAIGNPIHNPKVKELYLKIIRGENTNVQNDDGNRLKTEISVEKCAVFFGSFMWQDEQRTTFTLKNTGNNPLVIQDVNTSCGCTTVDYSQEPVAPGKEATLNVVYKAEHPGHFEKTITVYCNTDGEPLTLKVSGNAE